MYLYIMKPYNITEEQMHIPQKTIQFVADILKMAYELNGSTMFEWNKNLLYLLLKTYKVYICKICIYFNQ